MSALARFSPSVVWFSLENSASRTLAAHLLCILHPNALGQVLVAILFAASDSSAQRFFTWFAEISEVTLQARFDAAAAGLSARAILFNVCHTLFAD